MDKIPVYKIQVNPSLNNATGVSAVSLVTYPAIESNFVALSHEDLEALKAFHPNEVNNAAKAAANMALSANSPRGEVTGPLLIPGFQIFRRDKDGNPYMIVFDEETIHTIRNKFSENGWHRNTNEQHSVPLAGNTIVELWIVKDPETDLSKALGLDVPKGTLMATMKIADMDYYEREILSGNLRGFSIEGWFDYAHELANANPSATTANPATASAAAQKSHNTNLNMKPKKGWLKSIFDGLLGNHTVDLSMHVVKDGGAKIIVVDETTEAFYPNDEGLISDTPSVVPDGEYVLEDDTTLVIADGKMTEIKPAVAAEPAADPAAEPAAEASEVAALAQALGVTVEALGTLAKANNVGLRHKGQLGKVSARQVCKAAEKATLSILVDPASSKPMYVDQNNGRIYFIEDHGGYLWQGDFVPAGTYAIAEGSLVVVVETEVIDEGTAYEFTMTRSYVDFEASTVPVEVLVPWLKKATSEIQELAQQSATKLNQALMDNSALKLERERLKSENEALRAAPAAKPIDEKPTGAPQSLATVQGSTSPEKVSLSQIVENLKKKNNGK